MTETTAKVLVWLPRIIGIAVTLFIGMFALDAFSDGKPVVEALGDFAIHLIPAGVMLAVVVVAWRHPWVGAVVFIGLALAYVLSVRRVDWMLVIGGPLLLVGVLFLLSGFAQRANPRPLP
jgi:hypothetical protein